ncbi:MAG: hypothetical protein FJ026_15080 [Chloroflexi bacterium]|nr:hypothetical protein [Chloroflexota bacterium]
MENEDPEVLAAHADQLNNGAVKEIRRLDMPDGDKAELLCLMRLAERVKHALTPVNPSPAYKQKLRLELLQMAPRGAGCDVVVARPAPHREMVIGAAIGSAVALVGGVAYLIRSYMQHRPHHPDHVRS